MLEVKNLRFRYPCGKEALKGIDFTLKEGEFLAVLGNNGAGKSTMLKCLNRIIAPDQGRIILNGESILDMSIGEVAKRMAFVAQTVPNTQMTVHDMVMLGRKPYMQWGFSEKDHRIVHEAMEQLDLTGLRGRYLNELSGGERQKVMLARALAQQPRLLLLDEPTSSLDLKNQYQVLQIARDICHETKISAIVVIHDLNLALRFCDRFLMMQEGALYRYGDASVIDRETLFEVYGVHGEMVEAGGHKMFVLA